MCEASCTASSLGTYKQRSGTHFSWNAVSGSKPRSGTLVPERSVLGTRCSENNNNDSYDVGWGLCHENTCLERTRAQTATFTSEPAQKAGTRSERATERAGTHQNRLTCMTTHTARRSRGAAGTTSTLKNARFARTEKREALPGKRRNGTRNARGTRARAQLRLGPCDSALTRRPPGAHWS